MADVVAPLKSLKDELFGDSDSDEDAVAGASSPVKSEKQGSGDEEKSSSPEHSGDDEEEKATTTQEEEEEEEPVRQTVTMWLPQDVASEVQDDGRRFLLAKPKRAFSVEEEAWDRREFVARCLPRIEEAERIQRKKTQGQSGLSRAAVLALLRSEVTAVRWRRTVDGRFESNAYFVRWSDGSLQLMLNGGKATINVDEHTFLQRQQVWGVGLSASKGKSDGNNVVKLVSPVDARLTFDADWAMQPELARDVLRTGLRKGLKMISVGEVDDPEKEMKARQAEEARMIRQRAAQGRRIQRATQKMAVDFVEGSDDDGDDDDDDDDDEDDQEFHADAHESEDELEYKSDSDGSDSSDDDDDDDDEEEERRQRNKKQQKKKSSVKSAKPSSGGVVKKRLQPTTTSGQQDKAANRQPKLPDNEVDQRVMQAKSSAPITKRRRVIEDDE